ncbi:IclR family transcriptional regulator [Pandoraea nosoerga]|uniref:Transcriptional regulator n=1 Tax=Pandoraea nosoerga TaxID=2508296 RepID=A0A5E4VVN8_9BURK|nr:MULTISPECIES: IclR family transcriptional regulator [Pandoraea]MBN4666202.1 IclR family transcriptional regulator [Pandoraea nosoerga]MBN4676257.1 IclR family transcriptional regulator [Pandoraea nosoerga]MBN4681294.1 IclR family transcriptional regulator [Pandoraea nosoerga]MBN4745369.1 IclR family transcriptional regulator [Pandoraea nosoerga]VVE16587.1 transcriptional regulator [Pandoraea nosoerga]
MAKAKATEAERPRTLASQTLFRGLDIVEAVAAGIDTVPALSAHTGITPSTTHRIASALVHAGYLRFEPRRGYRLGNKLIELGFLAYRQIDLPRVARPALETLASETRDTVHLAVADGWEVMYLDKLPGQRAVEISSRIGGRKPICVTGVGKALLLDQDENAWRAQLEHFQASVPAHPIDATAWLARMHDYARLGYAFDLEDDTPQIRCVAAPVYDASQRIVAAISVSSTTKYMSRERMQELVPRVKDAAAQISRQLGWSGHAR